MELLAKKLGEDGDGTYITVDYIVTDGRSGNGASNFSFSGTLESANNQVVDPGNVTITTNQSSTNGGDIEPIDSVKYYAPRLYSSQYRAVTSRDYEAIVKEYILILNQFLWLVENKWIHHNLRNSSN